MLGSITPLGERGRRSRYWLTVTAFVAGSTLAGAAAGLLAGLAGAALDLGGLSSHVRLPAIAIAVALGLAFDLRLGGLRLPSPRRQVNEDWLTAYRGWVYGVGFGAQLGVGVVTIVTSSATYLVLVAAALTAQPGLGAAIGAAAGAARGLTILAGARVRSPGELHGLHRRLRAWEPPVRRGAQAAMLILAIAAVAV